MSVDDASERRREIGQRVARWRARRGLTRKQFADLCGRSLSWVDKVESGERGLLRLPMLERVAEVLHVSVEALTDPAEVRQAKHCLDAFEIAAVRAGLQSYHSLASLGRALLARADIDRLKPERGAGSAAHLSLYGMLLLKGAVVAARASDHAVARDLLDEGHNVDHLLGYDGNECFTAFGSTNAHLHQVAVLLDLGDGAGAIAAARQVTPDGLSRLPKERRANYYIDVARAHGLSGHRDDAVNTLLTADSLFPDEIRCRPIAIDLVGGLRGAAPGTRPAELEQLAGRIGLTHG